MSELHLEAASYHDDTVELRRAIHREPELDLDNPLTQNKVLESLTGLGFDITTGDGCTSVVADLDTGRPGPTVLLRADMDALPLTERSEVDFASTFEGRMHACGHDGHTAMLVGAARLLAANRSELTGTVRFMFQPGEEGSGGARVMIDEGVLNGVDRAFAIHLTPNAPSGLVVTRSGPLLASSDEFVITVNGSGGHASMPHGAIDPIPAAAAIVTGIHTMIGRTIDAHQPGVVTVGRIEAGTTSNIIPASAELEGTIRAVSERTREELRQGVARVAEHTAAAHNCSCVTTLTDGYPVTSNHGEQVDLVERVVNEQLGGGKFITIPSPVMGAEDFSYVLNEVPGALVFLGACPEGEEFATAAANHSDLTRLNEASFDTGVALYAAMALANDH